MKIVTQVLSTSLSQDIKLNMSRREYLGSIAPLIVMVGNPSGTFYFTILQDGYIIYLSSFTASDLKTALNTINNNLYVYYPIIPSIRIKKGNYTLMLTADSYTKTDSSFIGWGQQHENIQNKMDYSPSGISQNSLTYRVKILKEGIYD